MVQQYLRPSDIRFTQDSIKQSFTDGTPLKDTFADLVRGWLTVDEIQCIACVKVDGHYWVIHGNRRLYLYQILEKVGKLQYVQVNIRELRRDAFEEKRTTTNNGGLPVCRQNRNLYWELMEIVGPRIQTAGNDTYGGSSYRRVEAVNNGSWSWWKWVILCLFLLLLLFLLSGKQESRRGQY